MLGYLPIKNTPLTEARGVYKSSLALFRAALDVLLSAVKSIDRLHPCLLALCCQPGQNRLR
nr:MAG TPA: hypothetical protein [Caudoviricetes sp.]